MRVPGVCRDPASAYDMNGIEGLGTMLGVETDRIDHGEGLFDGLENRSVIVHIGADRFESRSFVREHYLQLRPRLSHQCHHAAWLQMRQVPEETSRCACEGTRQKPKSP
jgi:hypothetical protein